MDSGLVAICVDGSLGHRDLTPKEAVEITKKSDHAVWLHLHVADHAAAADLLEREFGFHELAVEDALSPNERPALSEYDDYLFLVVPAISHVQQDGVDYVEIGFFLRQNYLISVAEKECPILDAWMQRWSKHPIRNGRTTADILHVLIDDIVDGYLPVLDGIEDEVDSIADSIIAGEKGRVNDLLRQKRRLLDMRRRITPMRDVINGLLRRDLDLIPEKTRPYFQDVYDHTSRALESIDLQRDTLTSLLDVHLSVVSNNLNEVMKKMTVIATVLMSAALIAGIYGMNFRNMPELSWPLGYPFAILLMILSSLGILGLFRWKKWI